MDQPRQSDGAMGCLEVIAVCLLVMAFAGAFKDRTPPTVPEQAAAIGGGPAAAVAGGWHK